MITKEKSGRFKKFERTIHPKNGIIPPLSAYVKLRRHSSRLPRTAFMVENMYLIEKLICSQEELHLAPRKTSNKQESVDNQYGE